MSSSTPVIRVAGVCNRPEAAFLLVRYRKSGSTDWSYHAPTAVVYGQTVSVLIPSVAPSTVYNVSLGYLSVIGEEPSSWFDLPDVTTTGLIAESIDGQGDLATLNSVNTPQIVANAATQASAQVNSMPVAIAYWGPGQDVFTELDSFTFTVSGEGEVIIQWSGLIEFNRSGANLAEIMMTSGAAPYTIGGTVRVGFVQGAKPRGDSNSTAVGVTLTHVEALAAGSHTFKIYGCSDVNTSALPVSAGGKAFVVTELKR